jgi:hypothetical protein
MTTKPRSEDELRAMYDRIVRRVGINSVLDGNANEIDGATLLTLKWALGGCLDEYHPPECAGDLPSCFGWPPTRPGHP